MKSNDLFLLALSDITNQSQPPDTYNDSSDSDVNYAPRRVLTPGAKFSSDEEDEDIDASDEEDGEEEEKGTTYFRISFFKKLQISNVCYTF